MVPDGRGTNQYGYSFYFDIMAESEIFGDNPVMNFEQVACPGQAVTDWDSCVCYENIAISRLMWWILQWIYRSLWAWVGSNLISRIWKGLSSA
jgi:hypothetical protein